MEVPEAFVAWWTRNAPSNVDLAAMSNVNRTWRTIVMRELLEQVQEANKEEEGESSSTALPLLLLPSMLRNAIMSGNNNNHHTPCARKDETFCAAWFHPAGIQIQQLDNNGWGEGESDMFVPACGVQKSTRSLPQQQQHERGPLCSNEWRGYRTPMDVLEPFGYAKQFVDTILARAEEVAASSATNGQTHNGNASRPQDAENYHSDHRRWRSSKTTIAVRGATLARPEGYCLCWDSSDLGLGQAQDGFLRSMMDRKRRRHTLQLEVLPRVLLSSKHKNPLNVEVESKQQKCLQFLNASGSNAVRLLTPPFDCGPIEGPITMFLVGIATEDGCFVSGLRRRCEVGHMHPNNLRDAMIDMSPVCLATDYQRTDMQKSSSPSESMFASRADRSYCDSERHVDSDDSSCAVGMNQDSEMNCKCDFGEAVTQSWNDDDDDEHPSECVWRGQRGPGLWHCYVCIFDKADSVIRIDGAAEPLEKCGSPDSPPVATLDGLTIESDHCFDMSLCLGDASIEEGEGAIAELAVFQGRMADTDIEQMEDFLMQKHGLIKPKPTDRAALIRQDEWKRTGRALIAQPPPWAMRVPSGIPLPVVARDRDVSWHRINAVTGKDVRVARIGSKLSNGSSDW